MQNNREIDRRSVAFGWIPFLFHRRYIEMSGARFEVFRHGHGPHRYLVIHGNENTARDVLRSYMKDHPGVGYAVTNTGRNIDIEGLRIDPNRMFSRAGAETSLRNLNRDAEAAKVARALDFLDRERPALLHHLTPPRGGRLFALHNNRGYSVKDELDASDRTSIKQPDLPGDFFLCTQASDYGVLAQSPYNVVLQEKPEPDDGSMSRLSARLGVRYINLECSIGEYGAQMERVRWLEEHLP